MEQIRVVFVVLVLIFSVFAMLVVPFPIRVHRSKSNVKDSNLEETKPLVINEELLDKEGNNAHGSTLDDPETTMSESNIGLFRLFPKFAVPDGGSQPDSNVEKSTKPPSLRFFQSPRERDKQGRLGDIGHDGTTEDGMGGEVSPEDYVEDYDGSPRKKGDEVKKVEKVDGGTPPTIPTEKTVPIPKYKSDYLGNWVYNPWGVTYGQMFRDTRFIGYKYSDLKIIYDKHTIIYNPKNVPTKKVCRKESTVYNDINQKRYLKHAFYHYPQVSSVVYVDLRKEIYNMGKSEECHVPSQINWRKFNECQMMRHMRMEYLVPFYPMIQHNDHMDYSILFTNFWPLDDDPDWWYNPYPHSPRWPSGTVPWWTHSWHWSWYVKYENAK